MPSVKRRRTARLQARRQQYADAVAKAENSATYERAHKAPGSMSGRK